MRDEKKKLWKIAKEGKVGACTRQERIPLNDEENDSDP